MVGQLHVQHGAALGHCVHGRAALAHQVHLREIDGSKPGARGGREAPECGGLPPRREWHVGFLLLGGPRPFLWEAVCGSVDGCLYQVRYEYTRESLPPTLPTPKTRPPNWVWFCGRVDQWICRCARPGGNDVFKLKVQPQLHGVGKDRDAREIPRCTQTEYPSPGFNTRYDRRGSATDRSWGGGGRFKILNSPRLFSRQAGRTRRTGHALPLPQHLDLAKPCHRCPRRRGVHLCYCSTAASRAAVETSAYALCRSLEFQEGHFAAVAGLGTRPLSPPGAFGFPVDSDGPEMGIAPAGLRCPSMAPVCRRGRIVQERRMLMFSRKRNHGNGDGTVGPDGGDRACPETEAIPPSFAPLRLPPFPVDGLIVISSHARR